MKRLKTENSPSGYMMFLRMKNWRKVLIQRPIREKRDKQNEKQDRLRWEMATERKDRPLRTKLLRDSLYKKFYVNHLSSSSSSSSRFILSMESVQNSLPWILHWETIVFSSGISSTEIGICICVFSSRVETISTRSGSSLILSMTTTSSDWSDE